MEEKLFKVRVSADNKGKRLDKFLADYFKKDFSRSYMQKLLADGSVYNAQQALDNKLIDEIGYMEEAVASAKSLAKITNAKVVEYNKPFSLQDWLGAKSGKSFLHFDRNTLYELTTPRLMYLWDAGLNF